MEFFHVNQSQSYNSQNKFIWSPTKMTGGKSSKGYDILKEMRKGDYILHYDKGIKAISIVTNGYTKSPPPKEKEYTNWCEVNVGYLVKLEEVIVFEKSIDFTQEQKKWLVEHSYQYSPYDKNCAVKQSIYASKLNHDYLKYIFSILLEIEKNTANRIIIESILSNYYGHDCDPYKFNINNNIDNIQVDKLVIEPKEKEIVQTNIKKIAQKRDPNEAIEALKRAEYKCEYSSDHKLFIRNNSDKNYTEPHHLIPLNKHEDFDYSLDVFANIVSLCSYCHNLLHYGRYKDKEPLLCKLYEERKEELKKCNLEITFEQLSEYYK